MESINQVTREIRERIKLERAVERLNRRIEQNRRKPRLASGVANYCELVRIECKLYELIHDRKLKGHAGRHLAESLKMLRIMRGVYEKSEA